MVDFLPEDMQIEILKQARKIASWVDQDLLQDLQPVQIVGLTILALFLLK